MNKYKTKSILTYEALALFLFGLQIYIQNIAMNSKIYNLLVLIYMGVILIIILKHKKIYPCSSYLFWILFAAYNLCLIYYGEVFNIVHSRNYLNTFVLNLALYIFSFNLFKIINNIERILLSYIRAITLSAVTIMWAQRTSILTSRIGQSGWREVEYYRLFGLRLVSVGANALAFMCAFAFVFIIILYYEKNRKPSILMSSILVITILLTGSRKGILLLILGIMIVQLIYSNNFNKKIKLISLTLIGGILIYILIQKIPALYNIVGERMNNLILSFWGNKTIDSSINTRANLIEVGLEFFRKNVIWGYGLDAFRVMHSGISADNNFVDILVSSGVIGFVLYYAYIPINIINYFKNRNSIRKVSLCLIILMTVFHYGSTIYYNRTEGPILCIFLYMLSISRRDHHD